MKIRRFSEASFLLGIILLGLATAIMSKANLGMSMVAAPYYLIAAKVGVISVGTASYIFQGLLIVVTAIISKKLKFSYLLCFLSAVLFGYSVDVFSLICFPNLTEPGLLVRALLFALSVPISSLAITLLLATYLPPQAPELFVKAIAAKWSFKVHKTKYAYDLMSCALSIAASLLFFGEVRFVGVGTVIYALVNAPLIGVFDKLLRKFIDFSPLFPKMEKTIK